LDGGGEGEAWVYDVADGGEEGVHVPGERRRCQSLGHVSSKVLYQTCK
jgi:hypothetical protein